MLYVCATPIGNLQDVTERALETFKKADIMACETINQTKKLMTCYGISNNLFSYREDNKEKASKYLIEVSSSSFLGFSSALLNSSYE